jgi:hypothetical protein
MKKVPKTSDKAKSDWSEGGKWTKGRGKKRFIT